MNDNQTYVARKLFANQGFVSAYVALLNLHGADDRDDTVNGNFRQLINRTSIAMRNEGGKAFVGSQTRESREVLRQYFHRQLANRSAVSNVATTSTATPTNQGIDMSINAKVAVQSVTYVFGRDIDSVSDEEVFEAIRKINKDVATLESTGVESRALTRRIGALKKQIAELVAVVDERAGGNDEPVATAE